MLVSKNSDWNSYLTNTLNSFGIGFCVLIMFRMLAWSINIDRENDLMSGTAPSFWQLDLWPTDLIDALISGIFSDFLFMTIAAIILAFLSGWVRRIFFFVLIIFLAANVEHIKYNFSNIRLDMIDVGLSPTFILGSLTPSFVGYSVLMGGAAAAALIIFEWRPSLWLLAMVWVVIFTYGLFYRPSPELYLPDWTYKNPFMPYTQVVDIPNDMRDIPADAFDMPVTEISPTAHYNLIIVFVEGLSALSIERGDMETFATLGKENIVFENYVGRQIITANGLYAALTGDTPSFVLRSYEWDNMTGDSNAARYSLPKTLANRGYQTIFLQAADLKFMDKEKHLTSLDFQIIRGDKHWKTAYGRNGWGVDDTTLMEEGLAIIDELPEDQPWFMSFLTTSTHPPYNVPEVYSPSRREALYYADQAVQKLITGLDKRGLLENTVVILTSDEGREIDGRNGFLNDLPLNHLPLIVLHPTLKQLSIATYIHNTDLRNLALTLMQPLDKQSLISSLPDHEDVVFGNVITGKLFWYKPKEETLIACWTFNFYCEEWSGQSELFSVSTPNGKAMQLPALRRRLSPQVH